MLVARRETCLVLEENWGIEIRYLNVLGFAYHLAFACMEELTHFCQSELLLFGSICEVIYTHPLLLLEVHMTAENLHVRLKPNN